MFDVYEPSFKEEINIARLVRTQNTFPSNEHRKLFSFRVESAHSCASSFHATHQCSEQVPRKPVFVSGSCTSPVCAPQIVDSRIDLIVNSIMLNKKMFSLKHELLMPMFARSQYSQHVVSFYIFLCRRL
jgi:hypothetical protein